MKKLTGSFYRKLGLAAVILAAGFCYLAYRGGAGGASLDPGSEWQEAPLSPDEGTGALPADITAAGDEQGIPAGEVTQTGGGVETGAQGNAARVESGVQGSMARAETGMQGEVSGEGADPNGLHLQSGTENVPVTEAEARLYVHVCGEVQTPGVYQMGEGQRIFDAIELAGGFTGEAATDYLNLAEPVQDGMKVTVPGKADVPKRSWMPDPGGSPGVEQAESSRQNVASFPSDAGKRVNLNTASKEELMTLRGIGEAKAADIIRYREQHGGFQKIEDVMKISGIKEAAFEKIKEDITVSP